MYKLLNNDEGIAVAVLRTRSNSWTTIPFDNANKDYQEYLEWVAEGNTPEEAE